MKITDNVTFNSDVNLTFVKIVSLSVKEKIPLEKGNDYPLYYILGAYMQYSFYRKRVEAVKNKNNIFEIFKDDLIDFKNYFNLLDESEQKRVGDIILCKLGKVSTILSYSEHLSNDENSVDSIMSIRDDVIPRLQVFKDSLGNNERYEKVQPLLQFYGLINSLVENKLFEKITFISLYEKINSNKTINLNSTTNFILDLKNIFYGNTNKLETLDYIHQCLLSSWKDSVINDLSKGFVLKNTIDDLKQNNFLIDKGFANKCLEALNNHIEHSSYRSNSDIETLFNILEKKYPIQWNEIYEKNFHINHQDNGSVQITVDLKKYDVFLRLKKELLIDEPVWNKLNEKIGPVKVYKKNIRRLEDDKKNKYIDLETNNYLIDVEKNNLNVAKEALMKCFGFITTPLKENNWLNSENLNIDKSKIELSLNVHKCAEKIVMGIFHEMFFNNDFKNNYEEIIEKKIMEVDREIYNNTESMKKSVKKF